MHEFIWKSSEYVRMPVINWIATSMIDLWVIRSMAVLFYLGMNVWCHTPLPQAKDICSSVNTLLTRFKSSETVSPHPTLVFQSIKSISLRVAKNQVNMNWNSDMFNIFSRITVSIHSSRMSSVIASRFLLVLFWIELFFKQDQCISVVDQMNTHSLDFSQIFDKFSSIRNRSQSIGKFTTFWRISHQFRSVIFLMSSSE